MEALTLAAVLLLAYANGANDNFKGVGTLFGSGAADYRSALCWSTAMTLLGSMVSVVLADKLVKIFSGKGLVPDGVAADPVFATAVAFGAGATVILATRFGFPISTTHCLLGGLAGAGLIASGSVFNFDALGSTFFMPLAFSPFLSALLSFMVYLGLRTMRVKAGITKSSCICVGELQPALVHSKESLSLPTAPVMQVGVGTIEQCRERYIGTILGIGVQNVFRHFHFLSAGIVCFTRGLNDTPKIAGILLLTGTFSPEANVLLITSAVLLGGLLHSRRIAETMGHKITKMNDGQGFAANLTTSLLVATASIHGMPVSTTHVSVGALFGIGAANKKGNPKVINEILVSWILTLPIAAVLAACFFVLLKWL